MFDDWLNPDVRQLRVRAQVWPQKDEGEGCQISATVKEMIHDGVGDVRDGGQSQVPPNAVSNSKRSNDPMLPS